jgi:hypothetical protein
MSDSDVGITSEAYSNPIANSDLGYCSRNVALAERTHAILSVLLFNQTAERMLDFGGGYGMLARLMRDKGWDFYCYDAYTENIFCRQQAVDLISPQDKFSVITAFEVAEHIPDAGSFFEKLFQNCETVIFTTELRPESVTSPMDWWYFSLETGQHICIFSRVSIDYLCEKYNAKLLYSRNGLHVISRQRMTLGVSLLLRAIDCLPGKMFARFFLKRKSLLSSDYLKLTGKTLD